MHYKNVYIKYISQIVLITHLNTIVTGRRGYFYTGSSHPPRTNKKNLSGGTIAEGSQLRIEKNPNGTIPLNAHIGI